MSELEQKHLAVAFTGVKVAADGPGEFEGYASVFGNTDLSGDRIVPGAFAADLPRFVRDAPILWSHDPSEPIGMPLDAREDPRGLFLRGLFHTTPLAQKARAVASERLAAKKSFGMSIGYRVEPGGQRRAADGVRELTKLRLLEVSLVGVPANPEAVLTGVKTGTATAAPAEAPVLAALRGTLGWTGDLKHRGLLPYRRVDVGDVSPALTIAALSEVATAAAALQIAPPPIGFFRLATAHEIKGDQVDFWEKAILGRATETNVVELVTDLSGPLLANTAWHEVAHVAGASEEQARQFETMRRRLAATAA